MNPELVIVPFAIIVTFGSLVWTVSMINRTKRERAKGMLELQNRLLEKFSTSHEFVAFLQTPEGRQFVKSFAEEPRRNPREKILKSITTGVILVVIGSGLIGMSFMIGIQPIDEPPFILGFLALFLGAGFIVSAVISLMLSKAWGLLPDERQKTVSPTSQS